LKVIVRRILREPVVHFMALGALIFAIDATLHPPARTDPHRIEIGKADIDRIRALYAQQWGAAPGAADMPNLVENYIRSEVLFREGVTLGLDTDDSVIRNRVMQKMEFLLQDATSIAQPSDAEMAVYLDRHAASYRLPEQVGFTQIYFSPSLRGDRAAEHARRALMLLQADPSKAAGVSGDPLMLPMDPSPRSREDLETDYGADFAARLLTLPTGSWQGPVRSALGLHLVLVDEHLPSRLPSLAEVRDRVHDDLMAERFRDGNDQAYAKLRSRYQIVVTPDASRAATTAIATVNSP